MEVSVRKKTSNTKVIAQKSLTNLYEMNNRHVEGYTFLCMSPFQSVKFVLLITFKINYEFCHDLHERVFSYMAIVIKKGVFGHYTQSVVISKRAI